MMHKLIKRYRAAKLRKKHYLPESVSLGYPVYLEGDIRIGPNTFVNSHTHIVAGPTSKIRIGPDCAISYNVHIRGRMHNPENIREIIEGDIIIGRGVWIAANSLIREGVTIGDKAIVGALSLVNKDVPEGAIVGGIPVKVIRWSSIPTARSSVF